jgi:thiol-disulfide isomerase/thioredoxin
MVKYILVAFVTGLTLCGSTSAQDSPLVAAARAAAARSAQRQRTLFVIPQAAPDVRTIRWFNSAPASLASFRGRVVLVDFWATWYAPCVAAYPEIQRLVNEFGPSGFTAVLIHDRYTKTAGTPPTDVVAESVIPTYIQQHRITLPVAIADRNELESLGIKGIPHYVLIDRRGLVRYSRGGRLPDAATIRMLLDDKRAD